MAGALHRGSGVVVQSQQYMATQLVQQALSSTLPSAVAESLSPPGSSSRMPEQTTTGLPGLLSFLSVAAAKESNTRNDMAKTSSGSKHGNDVETSSTKKQQQRSAKAQAKSSKADDDDDVKTPKPGAVTAVRTDKSKQLIDHFKKLLLKGFQLQYVATKGVIKHRLLRLEEIDARHITFISTRDLDASGEGEHSSSKKKSARLLIVNIQRVSATLDLDGNISADIIEDLELAKAFSLDNGKGGPMVFQAESQKNRDLLVAGLRLLIAEHKQYRDLAPEAGDKGSPINSLTQEQLAAE